MIRFDLSIELDYNVLSESDYVFIIQPTNTPYQRVTWESLSTQPMSQVQEEVHGSPANRHLRVRASPGPFKLRYDAIVDLVHHFALPADLREVPIADLPASVLQYIYPSRYCQSDRLMDVARREFGTMTPGYARVEAMVRTTLTGSTPANSRQSLARISLRLRTRHSSCRAARAARSRRGWGSKATWEVPSWVAHSLSIPAPSSDARGAARKATAWLP